MRSVVMVLLLVSAMMLTGTHASWWTRTRDKVENAAIGAATSAAVGAVVGKRETKASFQRQVNSLRDFTRKVT
nr:hypothetical protein BaRGS_021034 [Batillaria attramentaria]